MCLGTAVQKRGEALKDEQEVLGHFADIAMETYALESALLRTRKRAAARGEDADAAAGGGRALLRPGRDGPRSRPRPASSWPRWRRATRSARCSPP